MLDNLNYSNLQESQLVSTEDLSLFEGINSLFDIQNIGSIRLSLLVESDINENIIIEEKLNDRLNFWRNFLGCDIKLSLIEDNRLGGYKKLSIDINGLSTNPNIRNHILNNLVPYLESVGFSLTFIDPSSIRSFSKEEISKYSRFFSGDWYKNLDGEILFKEMILYLENMLCFLMKKNEGIKSISSDLENIGEEHYGEITVLIGLMKKIEGIQLESLISAYKRLQRFRDPMTQGIALLTEEIISKTDANQTSRGLISRTRDSLRLTLKKGKSTKLPKNNIGNMSGDNNINSYYKSFIENEEINLEIILKSIYRKYFRGKISFDYNGKLYGHISITNIINENNIRFLLLSDEIQIKDLTVDFKGISYVEFEDILERLYGIIRFLDANKTSSPDEGLDEYIEKTDFNKLGEEELHLLMEYLDIPNEGKTDNSYSLKSADKKYPRFLNKKYKKLLLLLSAVNRIFKYHYIILLATETKSMVQLNKLLRQYRTNLTKIAEIVDKTIIEQIIDSFPKTQENNKGPNGKQRNIKNQGRKELLNGQSSIKPGSKLIASQKTQKNKTTTPLEHILGDISGKEKVEIELGIGDDKYSEIKKKIIENISDILRSGSSDDISFVKQFLRILSDIDLLVVEGIKEKDKKGHTIEYYKRHIKDIFERTKSIEGKRYLISRFYREFGIKEAEQIFGVIFIWSNFYNILGIKSIGSFTNYSIHSETDTVVIGGKTVNSDNSLLLHFGQCLLFEVELCEINKDNILKLIKTKGEESELYLSILKNILGIDDKLNINELLKTKDGSIKKIDELASTINNTKTVKGKTFLLECVLEKINENELINFIKSLDSKLQDFIYKLLGTPNGVDINLLESINFNVNKSTKEKMELIGRFGTILGKKISSKIIFGHISIQDCYKLLKETQRGSGKDILREIKGVSIDHNIFDDKFETIFNQSNNNTVKELDNDTISLVLEIMSKTTDYKTREEIYNIFLKYPLFGEENNVSYSKTLDILFKNSCIIILSIPFLRTTDFSYFLDNANVESMEMLIKLSISNGLYFKITKDWKNTFNAFYYDRDIIETIIPYYKIFSLEYISFSNEIVEIIGKNRDPYKLKIICRRLKIVLGNFELSDLGIFKKAIFWQTLENMNDSIFSFITNGNNYNGFLRQVIDISIPELDNKIKNYRDNGNSKKVNKLLKIRKIITNLGRDITFINFNAKILTNPLVSEFLTKAGFIEFIILLITPITKFKTLDKY